MTAAPPPLAIVAALVENRARFLSFLRKRVGSAADAEDILQDALVRGLAHAGDVRDDETAVAWFYRVLRNSVSRSLARAAGRRGTGEARRRAERAR